MIYVDAGSAGTCEWEGDNAHIGDIKFRTIDENKDDFTWPTGEYDGPVQVMKSGTYKDMITALATKKYGQDTSQFLKGHLPNMTDGAAFNFSLVNEDDKICAVGGVYDKSGIQLTHPRLKIRLEFGKCTCRASGERLPVPLHRCPHVETQRGWLQKLQT